MINKVLFLNPPFVRYDGVEGQGGKTAPLNLAYLAAHLRQKHGELDISILDCEALNMSYEKIRNKISEINPDVVAITFPTPVYNQIKTIVKDIKGIRHDIVIVVGGPHPTISTSETLVDIAEIDFAVMGEGEETLTELVGFLISGKKNYDEILGLAFRQSDGGIIVNELRPLIADLDSLPFPARDLLQMEIYYLPPTKVVDNGQFINIISGRGCPYSCAFCTAESVWRRRYRVRSVENVIEEMSQCIKNYSATSFNFHDELFTADLNRVRNFCNEIKQRGWDISWTIQARVDSINDEILALMRLAGCKRIGFGFESGSQRILNKICKGATLDQARKAVELCRKNDIMVSGAFIIGYLDEDPWTVNQTINFACSLDLDTAAFFIAIPYPGTRMYTEAKANGYIRSDFDWSDFCSVSNHIPPMDQPDLSSDELLRLKRKAFLKFYLRPKYIWYRLRKIKSGSDLINIFRGLKIFKNVLDKNNP